MTLQGGPKESVSVVRGCSEKDFIPKVSEHKGRSEGFSQCGGRHPTLLILFSIK